MAEQHTVQVGQVYESCPPTFVVDGHPVHTRIRVIGAPGWLSTGKAVVATLTDDGRQIRTRSLSTAQLHATGTTAAGRERRTGYRLVDGDGRG